MDDKQRIRIMLMRNNLTQVWLIHRLAEQDVYTDKTELSAVLRGVRRGKKAETVISKSLGILQLYETLMGV